MQDVNCAIHLCSLLHRRYSDFSPLLLRTLQVALTNINKEDKVIYTGGGGGEGLHAVFLS